VQTDGEGSWRGPCQKSPRGAIEQFLSEVIQQLG
jgi:hypothetical protein